jgi:hypothetical protein
MAITNHERVGKALVQSWPEIIRLARAAPRSAAPGTEDLFYESR